MAKYLVTGVAGFIGRSIAAALLARGESVRGIDSFITGKRANLIGLEAMEFIEGDLADPAACAQACAGVEIIFHEAALASVPRSVAGCSSAIAVGRSRGRAIPDSRGHPANRRPPRLECDFE